MVFVDQFPQPPTALAAAEAVEPELETMGRPRRPFRVHQQFGAPPPPKEREDLANVDTATAAAAAAAATTAAAKPPRKALMAPPASAAEVAQYERHWAFLLQAELSKSMGDVQVGVRLPPRAWMMPHRTHASG